MGNEHTITELKQLQSLSLADKIKMTKERIKAWVDTWGINGVYVSFSGGKDSTVLLSIAREMYPTMKAMFVDTGLEYPEIREFVKTFDNVDWLKPKMNFREVIEKYGYPFISKEVSECVQGARKYLTTLLNDENVLTDRQTSVSVLVRSSYWNRSISEISEREHDICINTKSAISWEHGNRKSLQHPTRGGR